MPQLRVVRPSDHQSYGAIPETVQAPPYTIIIEPVGKFSLRGASFQSAAEVACAVLLDHYLPCFQIERHHQIVIGINPQGHALTVDFMVGGVLVEYHEPQLLTLRRKQLGDFRELKEKNNFFRALRNASKSEREVLTERKKREALDRYRERRSKQVAKSKDHSRRELVVVSSAEELYDSVMTRFRATHLPSRALFVQIFEDIRHDCRTLHKEEFSFNHRHRTYRKPRHDTPPRRLESKRLLDQLRANF